MNQTYPWKSIHLIRTGLGGTKTYRAKCQVKARYQTLWVWCWGATATEAALKLQAKIRAGEEVGTWTGL